MIDAVDVGIRTAAASRARQGGALLRVEGLTRRFGARVAVDRLSFEVWPAEIFGLLGPNGAGKSTTFAMLSSLLSPDSGKVFFEGAELSLDDRTLRARMGVVFQRNSLDDQLTARENLLLGARLYGLSSVASRARVAQMLRLIELEERADERVKGWSGGMRRRLELGRALVHRPRVLLMDEPTQGLDEASFRKFWAHLRALRATEGVTLLVTTHRPEEAEGCDRLAVLESGRLIACDTPLALASRIGGDVITLEGDRPEELALTLKDRLRLEARVVRGAVQVEVAQGHAQVPRIVEAFAPGRLASVNLRRPSLADVFLQLTGRSLLGPPPGAS